MSVSISAFFGNSFAVQHLDHAGRIAYDHSIVRRLLGRHGTRAHHRVPSLGHAWQDGRSCADPRERLAMHRLAQAAPAGRRGRGGWRFAARWRRCAHHPRRCCRLAPEPAAWCSAVPLPCGLRPVHCAVFNKGSRMAPDPKSCLVCFLSQMGRPIPLILQLDLPSFPPQISLDSPPDAKTPRFTEQGVFHIRQDKLR